jgi:hypothetical protein
MFSVELRCSPLSSWPWNRKEDTVARPTRREKLALVKHLLTQTPTPAQRKAILTRLAEEVAKDAIKLQQSQVELGQPVGGLFHRA